MICKVFYDSTQVDLSSPRCLKEFHILEMFINRWVPNENRGDDESKASIPNEATSNKKATSTQSIFEFYDSD